MKGCLLGTIGYTQFYSQGPAYSPMAFAGRHDPGSHLQPSDEGAGAWTTQPI